MLGKRTRRIIGGGFVILGCMVLGFNALLPMAADGLDVVYPNEPQNVQEPFSLFAVIGIAAILIGILLVVTASSS